MGFLAYTVLTVLSILVTAYVGLEIYSGFLKSKNKLKTVPFSNSVFTAITGAPGTGKSTVAGLIKRQADKLSIPVYSNFPLAGARRIVLSVDEWWMKYDTRGSIIVIDEAGGIYNSRNQKTVPMGLFNFFATARHRRTQIFILVQAWDRFDKSIRELCTKVVLLDKSMFPEFTVIRKYSAKLKLIEDENHNATEFKSCFHKLITTWYFRPADYKCFDSWYDDYVFSGYPVENFPVPDRVRRRYKVS
jgi:hypothetical protein